MPIPIEDILTIRTHADLVDEIEQSRKRMTNRLDRLVGDDEWGKAMPESHPQVSIIREDIAETKRLEAVYVKHLVSAFDLLPDHITTFVADTPGLGAKGVGRWLGATLDPAWHYRELRPRRIRELYAYCGLSVVDGSAPRRRKGQQSNWNGNARMRAWNMAMANIKMTGGGNRQRSPYRDVYEEAKDRYVTRNEARPADLKLVPAHVHAQAIRIVMKRIVRDLWEQFGGEVPTPLA